MSVRMEESTLQLNQTFVRKERKKKEVGDLRDEVDYYEKKYEALKKVNKYLEKKIKKLKGWKTGDVLMALGVALVLITALVGSLVVIF